MGAVERGLIEGEGGRGRGRHLSLSLGRLVSVRLTRIGVRDPLATARLPSFRLSSSSSPPAVNATTVAQGDIPYSFLRPSRICHCHSKSCSRIRGTVFRGSEGEGEGEVHLK